MHPDEDLPEAMSGRTRDAAPEPSAPSGELPVEAPETADPAAPPAPSRVDARAAGSSFGWSAVSFTASKLLVFVVTLVMARLLVPEDFGVVAVGLAIIAFLEVALDLGVGSALVYEQERGITPRVQTAFTLNLGIASICTLVGVLAAPAVAGVFDVEDVGLLRVLFLYFLLRGLVQVPDAVLRRDLAFRKRAGVEISRAVARGAVSVPLAVAGAGPWALVVGILASEALGVLLTWWAARFLPTFRIDRSAIRTLLGFGTSVLALKILGAVLENADYYIVGARLGTYDLGIYTLAYRVPEIVLANVFWIFSSVAFSIYSRARSDDPAEVGTVATRALQLITLFAFPAGVGVAIVSMPLTVALLGWEWEDAAAPMTFVALSMAASSIGYASGDIFPAMGRPGLLIKIVVPMVVVKVTGLLLAAPYGLTAMAATLAGMSVVFAAARLTVANRLLGLSVVVSLRAMRPGAIAAVGAAAGALPVVLLAVPDAETLTLAVIAGLAGTAALLLLFCRSELRELAALVRSMRGSKKAA